MLDKMFTSEAISEALTILKEEMHFFCECMNVTDYDIAIDILAPFDLV